MRLGVLIMLIALATLGGGDGIPSGPAGSPAYSSSPSRISPTHPVILEGFTMQHRGRVELALRRPLGASRALAILAKEATIRPAKGEWRCRKTEKAFRINTSCAITKRGSSGVIRSNILLAPNNLEGMPTSRDFIVLHELAHVIWLELRPESRSYLIARMQTSSGRWLCGYGIQRRPSCASYNEQWADEYARLTLALDDNTATNYQTPPLLTRSDLQRVACMEALSGGRLCDYEFSATFELKQGVSPVHKEILHFTRNYVPVSWTSGPSAFEQAEIDAYPDLHHRLFD